MTKSASDLRPLAATGLNRPDAGIRYRRQTSAFAPHPRGEQNVNTRREPRDPAAYRRDRRQAVLRHHPDTGGDTESLVRALEEVDRRHGVTPAGRGGPNPTAEQIAAVAVTALAGVAAVGLSLAMNIIGRRR